jgi:signal peptidase II
MMAVSAYLYGPWTRVGLAAAVITAVIDQAVKLWLLFGFELGDRGIVALGPFVDLVLTWNTGISYGLFPQNGALGQWMLFAVKIIAVGVIWLWLARAESRLMAIALGLIVGGAVGNAVDRALYGAVADFVLLHVTINGSRLNWYIFNLADVAIVAGVAGILYDSVSSTDAAKAP